jgi:hypothetical protein
MSGENLSFAKKVCCCFCTTILLIIFWILVITGVIKLHVLAEHAQDLFYAAMSMLAASMFGLGCMTLVACGYENPVTIFEKSTSTGGDASTSESTEDISVCNCICYHVCCCCPCCMV